MKIIIVRHGDPDYEHDSLTDRGKMEAALVAERIAKLKVDYFYQSPLGRAQATAKYTLDKMGRTATTYDWPPLGPISDMRHSVGIGCRRTGVFTKNSMTEIVGQNLKKWQWERLRKNTIG